MKRGTAGFTLPELAIALAIGGLMLSMGVPAMQQFLQNNRLDSIASDFISAVNLARIEAQKRQQTVSICASSNATDPAATCSQGDFNGWIVFEDSNASCVRDAAEPVLRAAQRPDGSVNVKSNGHCLAVAPSGFLQPAANISLPAFIVTPFTQATQTVFCDSRGLSTISADISAGRGVDVRLTGRSRVVRDATTINSWGRSCP